MDKEKVIGLISGRIIDEYRKHQPLDWQNIAAAKIYSQWLEYYAEQTKSLTDEIAELKVSNSKLNDIIAQAENVYKKDCDKLFLENSKLKERLNDKLHECQQYAFDEGLLKDTISKLQFELQAADSVNEQKDKEIANLKEAYQLSCDVLEKLTKKVDS